MTTASSSEHGKTQLNQGFLTHPRTDGVAEPRGEGFELRTDRHGAIRAAEGLLLLTEAKPYAQGKQLDRESMQAQLDSARKVAKELSNTAKKQKADPTEIGPEGLDEEGQPRQERKTGNLEHMTEAVRSWEAGTNTDPEGQGATAGQPGKQALLLARAPGGIGLSSAQEMVLVAGQNFDTITHRDAQQTTGRRWIHNVGKKISLFVHGVADKVNLKLIAAKGHIHFLAQSGNVEIVAEQNMRLRANQKKQQLVGYKEILLSCGGAYIRMKDGKIELHAPGTITVKYADYSQGGPARMDVPPINVPLPKELALHGECFKLTNKTTGEPLAKVAYCIETASGNLYTGYTDAEGSTRRVYFENSEGISVRWGRDAIRYIKKKGGSIGEQP